MKLKKILASVAAGAMIVSTLALPTFADGTVDGTITYDVSNGWFTSTDEWGQVWIQAWGGSLTVNGAYVTFTDGTTADVAYDSSNVIAIIGDGAVVDDYTTVASVTYEVSYDETQYNDEETWIGGGIGVNSTSTGWVSVEWGKASGEKPIAIEDSIVTEEADEPTTEVVEQTVSTQVYYTNDKLDNPYDDSTVDLSTMTLAELVPDTEAVSDISSLTYTLTCADDVSFNEYTYLYFVVTVDGTSTIYQVQGITGDDEWTTGLVLADQVLTLDSTIAAGQTYSVSVYTQSWEGAANEVFTIETTIEVLSTSGSTETGAETGTEAGTETGTESGTETGTESTEATSSSNNDAASSSNNDAGDDGDFAYGYLFAIVALAGVALVGSKKYHA